MAAFSVSKVTSLSLSLVISCINASWEESYVNEVGLTDGMFGEADGDIGDK